MASEEKQILEENTLLRDQLEEYKEIVEGIRNGNVDALAISKNGRADIYSLESSDFVYRVLVENFAEGALNVSGAGLILYANPAVDNLLGSTNSSIIGTEIFALIDDEYKETFRSLFKESFSGSCKGDIVLSYGERKIHVNISLSSLYPRFHGIGILITDLSERKKSAAELSDYKFRLSRQEAQILQGEILQKSTERFQWMANSIPQKVWTANAAGVMDYFNKRWAENLFISSAQLMRNGWKLVIHDADWAATESRWSESVASGEPFEIEHRMLSRDNSYRWHLSRAIPQKDEQGTLLMWVGSTTDVHEQKTFSQLLEKRVHEATDFLLTAKTQLEQQFIDIQKKNQELELANSELLSFTYVASHDLNEPLRKIRLITNLISDRHLHELSPESRDLFERMHQSASHMKNLIEALLSYSKINNKDLNFVETDLAEILAGVKDDLTELVAESGTVITHEPLPVLNIIPYQFTQLFTNLIGNAIKYGRSGIAPAITISSETVDVEDIPSALPLPGSRYQKISFADNGIGFEQIYQHKIFQLFQRLHTRQDYSGTGIGLAICAKIIQNHQGFIDATGKPGVGSVFNIYLPIS